MGSLYALLDSYGQGAVGQVAGESGWELML
jgi:hypothetical protein